MDHDESQVKSFINLGCEPWGTGTGRRGVLTSIGRVHRSNSARRGEHAEKVVLVPPHLDAF